MRLLRQLLPFASLLLLLVLLSVLKPDTFLTFDNFMNIFRRSSVNAILAVGMTAIIISGGIDLSVGSMLAVAGMVGAWTMHHFSGETLTPSGMWLGTLAGIATGTCAGFLNGALINGLKLPPFILTLGTMSAFRGVAYVMNDGQPYNVPAYKYLGDGELFGVPVSILIAAVIVLIAIFILNRTTLGSLHVCHRREPHGHALLRRERDPDAHHYLHAGRNAGGSGGDDRHQPHGFGATHGRHRT